LLIVGGYLLVQALAYPMRSEPLVVSKINTAFQIMLVGLLLAQLGLGLEPGIAVQTLVYTVALTTVLSGAAYLVRWTRALAGLELTP
jgi:cardiolipin synthase (CMP-forming)